MISKRMVLRRVENFKQRRRRIAAEIRPHLVDLIQHHHRIARAGLAKLCDDSPRHRTDVRSTMPANIRFIAHPAQCDTNKIPAHRLRNALTPMNVLPTPGGPTKQRIAPAPSGFSFPYFYQSIQMIRRRTHPFSRS